MKKTNDLSRPKIQQFHYELPPHVVLDDQRWRELHAPADVTGREAMVVQLIQELAAEANLSSDNYHRILRPYVRQGLPWLSKSQLQRIYQDLCQLGWLEFNPELRTHLQMKPVRSQAGVTVVTVLTKPYACPGKCIFCPTDVRMPKSYLHDEPGAQRAERYAFDPYEQTAGRIKDLETIGHVAEKIELLILGGTWSSYPRLYQEWFIKRCFDAMNEVEAPDLPTAQKINSTGQRRNVGLVVETRQDHITPDELRWLRYLGVTKVQVGIQSLDEKVLELNKRGHDVQATRTAFRLLRLAGFKIHGHWMPNLLGATPESDLADYDRIWNDPAVKPDELKIYPCMLLENAELYEYWQRGEYKPYTEEEVTDILVECLARTPRYARLTRVIRDIPTTNVVEGFKKANLRQVASQRLKASGRKCVDIRSREIQRNQVRWSELHLQCETYETDATTEHFLSYETEQEQLAGFLRLSFPHQEQEFPLPELQNQAMIREVHVYGPALGIGDESKGEAQHIGVGSALVQKAIEMAKAAGYAKIAVISAIGTQHYYAKHGFVVDGLYMTRPL